jgi:adenylate kinase
MDERRQRAILLLGPTGAGKTPLGAWLEAHGLRDAECVHFDFGENLRQIVARNRPDQIVSDEDIAFLRGVLERGVLLEDAQFPLAERIVRSFLAQRCADHQTWVVLNGLPRHAGQARAIGAVLDVRAVVCLECSAETVIRRLANNVGGDRAGRTDDRHAEVQKKLAVFWQRTAPLVDYYRQQGLPIETIPVTDSTTAEEVGRKLAGNEV